LPVSTASSAEIGIPAILLFFALSARHRVAGVAVS
jgi:hypothetical protein